MCHRRCWSLAGLIFLTILLPEIRGESGSQDYSCRRAGQPMTIDADLSDWTRQQAMPLMLVSADNVAIPTWTGPDDCSAIIYLMWDDDNLYFAARVTDNVHHRPDSDGGMYVGDSFQIAFDPRDDTLLPGYDGNDMEIGIGDTATGPVVFVWVGGQSGVSGVVAKDLAKVAFKRDKDGKSGVYEAAISWKLIKPFSPVSGRSMGFNLIYNDNDSTDEGRRGWLMWTPGIAEEKLAFTFRNLVLVEAGKDTGSCVFTTNRKYYDDNQTAILSCYLPGRLNDDPSAKPIHVGVKITDGTQTLFHETRQAALGPEVSRIDFTYKMAKSPATSLTATAEVLYPGTTAPTVLTTQILGLNAAMLTKQADELAALNAQLREKIVAAEKKGLDMSYPHVTAAVIDVILKYRRQDLANKELIGTSQPLGAIRTQFDALRLAADRATSEVARLSAHPDHIQSLPRTEMTDLVIKKGSFYKGDQPVMLIGPSGWWTVFDDLPLIAEMGFNLVSGTATPETVVPVPGQTRTDYLRAYAERMTWARQSNLAVDFLPSPHPMPAGWLKAYPDIKEYGGNGWMGASLYNPHVRQMVEEFWNALIPYLCDQPALAMWDVINEWSFYDGAGRIHSTMRVRFHNHLRERYKSIAALNAKWKSQYRSFDAIDPLKFDRQKTVPAFYDYERFRHAEATQVMIFMQNLIRRYDSKTPTHVKIIAATDVNPEQFGANGIDREAIGDVLAISGCDCGATINFDLYKSLHPAKPSIDSEVHTAVNTTAGQMRASIWNSFLHGQSARILFAWENAHTSEMMAAGAILHIPETLEAAGRTGLDVRRLAGEIVKFQQAIPTAQVAILFSQPSMILDEKYPPILRNVHSGLFFLDTQTRFISERQIREGGLGKIRLLIVPGATFVSDDAYARILAFAKSGGAVYVSPGSLSRGPYDNARTPKELTDAGIRSFASNANDLTQTLDAMLKEAKIDRPIRPIGADGSRVANLEFRAVNDGAATLAYLINHGASAVNVTLKTDRKIARAHELICGQDVTFPLTIPPQVPMLLRIEF